MLKKFISYYSNHKKLFTLDLLCAFALALCDLVYPMITREIINDVVPCLLYTSDAADEL